MLWCVCVSNVAGWPGLAWACGRAGGTGGWAGVGPTGQAYDQDGSGTIDKEELERLMTASFKASVRAYE